MPNGQDSPLPSIHAPQQVAQIMDRCQSYSSFGTLFDALMNANGLSNLELARKLTRQTGRTISKNSIQQYRCGERDPSYSFIADILATNVLNFDPRRVSSTDEQRPSGDQRIALFSAAGLIEVTPSSIVQWNQEVLAGYCRRLENDRARPPPRWGDLMGKLLSFHMQGGRQSYEDIAIRCNADENAFFPDSDSATARLIQLLRNARPPSERERRVLYRYVNLKEGQIAVIEDGIASGAIPLGYVRKKTAFTQALAPLLDKLSRQGIPLKKIVLLSDHMPQPGAIPLLQQDLSCWRHGRQRPTLAKLRALISALRQCGPGLLSNPVTLAEIDRLVTAGGFRPEQLTDTTHDIIAGINEQTTIKPLLRALQSAIDTCRPMEEIQRRGDDLGYAMPSVDMLRKWETSEDAYPTGEQVRELLHIHDHLIRQNGFPPLSEEENAKVLAVAERDYSRWKSLSHTAKMAEKRPRSRRQPPSSSFDGIEHGR